MPKPLTVVPDLEAELDDLFALRPEEFTRARNDLAHRLKQAGQADAAAGVRRLRKPTIPVWAVNQLARRHRDEIRALLDAGDRLRAAQQAALRGEGRELRTATAELRNFLRDLTRRADELLQETGHSVDPKRVSATLQAAAVDPARRDLLEQGRLSEELEATGFGALAGMDVTTKPEVEQTKSKATSAAVERRQRDRLRKLRDGVTKAKRDAAKAERALARAETRLTEAREKAALANDSVRRAETEVEQAET